jgi:outer membrane protein assembly factor BamB
MTNRYLLFALCSLLFIGGCSKTDPILPGVRTSIFPGTELKVLNKTIPDLPDAVNSSIQRDCPYRQDSANIIWDGSRKIFSGYPTENYVESNQAPICHGGFVYAGLSTGELVKINPKTRAIAWIADIYRASNMTGGASQLDIVAPLQISGNYIYAGGIGDAFCKINMASGKKSWCIDIGVALPFVLVDNYAFVVSTDNSLYAVNTAAGTVYWSAQLDAPAAPVYENKTITVGDQSFDAATGVETD